jgi:hypothetical protein
MGVLNEKRCKTQLSFFDDGDFVVEQIFYTEHMNEKVRKATKWFTLAMYKSLLQKCIRVRPISVTLGNGELVDTIEVVKTCFLKLLLSPGSFIPDLQMFVSGVLSNNRRKRSRKRSHLKSHIVFRNNRCKRSREG